MDISKTFNPVCHCLFRYRQSIGTMVSLLNLKIQLRMILFPQRMCLTSSFFFNSHFQRMYILVGIILYPSRNNCTFSHVINTECKPIGEQSPMCVTPSVPFVFTWDESQPWLGFRTCSDG